MWVGIINHRVLGPYLSEGNLTADPYLDFQRLELIPTIAVIFPNEIHTDIPNERIWVQLKSDLMDVTNPFDFNLQIDNVKHPARVVLGCTQSDGKT